MSQPEAGASASDNEPDVPDWVGISRNNQVKSATFDDFIAAIDNNFPEWLDNFEIGIPEIYSGIETDYLQPSREGGVAYRVDRAARALIFEITSSRGGDDFASHRTLHALLQSIYAFPQAWFDDPPKGFRAVVAADGRTVVDSFNRVYTIASASRVPNPDAGSTVRCRQHPQTGEVYVIAVVHRPDQ
ncbi:hypothetical protein [Streptomyces sp. 900105245]